MPNRYKPKNIEDLPGTKKARGKYKLCMVIGEDMWTSGSYDPPEPPEPWVAIQFILARTKREAKLMVVKNPDSQYHMDQYIDEIRSECNPFSALWVQYLNVIPDDALEDTRKIMAVSISKTMDMLAPPPDQDMSDELVLASSQSD